MRCRDTEHGRQRLGLGRCPAGYCFSIAGYCKGGMLRTRGRKEGGWGVFCLQVATVGGAGCGGGGAESGGRHREPQETKGQLAHGREGLLELCRGHTAGSALVPGYVWTTFCKARCRGQVSSKYPPHQALSHLSSYFWTVNPACPSVHLLHATAVWPDNMVTCVMTSCACPIKPETHAASHVVAWQPGPLTSMRQPTKLHSAEERPAPAQSLQDMRANHGHLHFSRDLSLTPASVML